MKISRKENIRVEISPKIFNLISIPSPRLEKMILDNCHTMVSQIKRHIDHVDNVEVKYNVKEYCSFCGRDWDVCLDDNDPDWPKGTPLCCSKAIDEFKNTNK